MKFIIPPPKKKKEKKRKKKLLSTAYMCNDKNEKRNMERNTKECNVFPTVKDLVACTPLSKREGKKDQDFVWSLTSLSVCL